MRTVLLGDSHLARVRRDLSLLLEPVVNAAVGGARAADLLAQATAAGVGADDIVVVSVGSNDAAPWKATSPSAFARALDAFVAAVPVAGLVYLTAPPVDEQRLTGAGDRTNVTVSAYAALGTDRFLRAGATIVDSAVVLAPLGRRAHADDGLHLTGAAYAVLLPALRAALLALKSR